MTRVYPETGASSGGSSMKIIGQDAVAFSRCERGSVRFSVEFDTIGADIRGTSNLVEVGIHEQTDAAPQGLQIVDDRLKPIGVRLDVPAVIGGGLLGRIGN